MITTWYPEPYESIFVLTSKIFYFDISISGSRTGDREVSSLQTLCPEKCATIFVFPSKKLLRFSISRGRTGVIEVSTVLKRCPKQCATNFVLPSKKICFDSQVLEVEQVKCRSQRYQRGAQNSMRPFSFLGPKNFLQ